MPQDLALYEELSRARQPALLRRAVRPAGAALERAIGIVAELVGLADRAGDRVKTFSGGMKRRLNLAAGLLHDPDILLLDEPTVGRRSAEPQRHLRQSRSAEGARQGAALHDALHGGGRAPRRPHRHHGPWPGDRRRHAERTAGACAGVGEPAAAGRAGLARSGVPLADRTEPERLMDSTRSWRMVRKDLQLFFSDRRAVIMSFAVPIAIASFFGSIFSGPQPERRAGEDPDRDRRSGRQRDLEGASSRGPRRDTTSARHRTSDRSRTRERGAARHDDRRRRSSRRDLATRPGAHSVGSDREALAGDLLYDPSAATELAMVRGILTEHVMQAVSAEMFGGAQGARSSTRRCAI